MPPVRSRGMAKHTRLAATLGILLIGLGALLAPLALTSVWASHQLLNTEAFSEKMGPLSSEPVVKEFVAEQATDGLLAQIDVSSWREESGTGLPDWLPGRVSDTVDDALAALERRVNQGVQAAMNRAVNTSVFDSLWEQGIRSSHGQLMQSLESTSAASSGSFALDIGVLAEQVKADLTGQEVPWARFIPQLDLQVVLLEYESMDVLRSWSNGIQNAALWLPWVSLVLLVSGVIINRKFLGKALGVLGLVFGLGYALANWAQRWVGDWAEESAISSEFVDLMVTELSASLFLQLRSLAIGAAIAAVLYYLVCWFRADLPDKLGQVQLLLGVAGVLLLGILFLLTVPAPWLVSVLLAVVAGSSLFLLETVISRVAQHREPLAS